MVDKYEYIVLADGFEKWRGTFRSCQAYCRNKSWLFDAYKELIIVKVVANGKEI